jgi:hypothetical protein
MSGAFLLNSPASSRIRTSILVWAFVDALESTKQKTANILFINIVFVMICINEMDFIALGEEEGLQMQV